MALTDTAIQKLKPKDRPYTVADGQSLSLKVMPNGSKLWQYRYRILTRPRVLALGPYPEVTLAAARRKTTEARLQVAEGIDPGQRRKRAKLVATLNAENTFKAIAAEFIDTKLAKEGRSAGTVEKAHWLVEKLGVIVSMPISDIKPPEIMAVLKKLESQRKHETAKRARSFASRVFRYAVATGRADTDPAALLSDALIAPKVKHHAAILDRAKFGDFLRRVDEFEGAPITRLALQIAPHTMTRPGELRKATWDEIDFDAKIWRIAPERMKMRKAHAIPLSEQVLSYLRHLQECSSPDGYIFPAFHTSRRPMSENTMNVAYRRMGFTADEVTSHGLRTTASTFLNESGKWHPDAIERALAHGDSDAIRGIYNRGQYWDERVKMMQWWSDYIDQLRQGGEIIAFGRVA